jgi:hypothetical protein
MGCTLATDKYVSVRIKKVQFDALAAFAEINYSTVNKLVQQGVDIIINDEIPVLIQAIEDARRKRRPRKR